MSIGERISERRKELNLSQHQMAKLLDVSRQAVSKWENDLAAPDTTKLIHLADILDMDLEYLATGRKSQSSTTTQVVTVEKVVEKVIEKPIFIKETIETEKIIEKPVIRKKLRTLYLRNPLEYALIGFTCFIAGLLIGLLI